ncbi:unnamed protein product [Parajaminaea phylloscopi]
MSAISLLHSCSSVPARSMLRQSAVAASSQLARSFASSSQAANSSAQPASAAKASSTASSSKPAVFPPSSCPAGTPMSGLSILKDGPELVAKPDEEYPPWLWTLINDPAMKTTSAGVDASADGSAASTSSSAPSSAAATKGELRVKQKQEMRELRAAAAALAAKKAAAAAASAGAAGSPSAASGTVPPVGSVEMLEAQAEVLVDQSHSASAKASTPEEREQLESAQRRELRKANRERIKGRNFLGR